ncbi:CusA/CzcA family heavy metal efflux RND transporter, partial [Salmonella enterica subsp. enterica serovar Typhimurium]
MLPRLSIDAVPDVTNIQVSVVTSAPGLSPVEVEQYLTYPVEASMNGLPGVQVIRSISRTAVSAVTIVFTDETDIFFARQQVNERLKQAEVDIPPGYGRPKLTPVSTGLGEIYEFYLTSKKHTPMELRTLMDWVVA